MKRHISLILITILLTLCLVCGMAACTKSHPKASEPISDPGNSTPADPAPSPDPGDPDIVVNPIESQGLVFSLKADDTYEVSGIGTCSDPNITIPATYNGKAVTSIGAYAFMAQFEIKSVTIPEGVTEIGTEAFWVCKNLSSVTLPNTLKSIGNLAFSYCMRLQSITIPQNVTNIADNTFFGCYQLAEIKNLSAIDLSSEKGKNNYLTHYAKAVYSGDYVSKVSTDEQGFILYTKDEEKILIGYLGEETAITLPQGVTEINDYAFHGCTELTSVTLPSSVKKIGYAAFTGCLGLTSFTIPESVTKIEENAFSGCYKLLEIKDLSSLNVTMGSEENGAVGYYAKAIYTGDFTSKISVDPEGYVFYTDNGRKILLGYNGAASNLTIPSSVDAIYQNAFRNNMTIRDVVIPNNVTEIGACAFQNSNIESVSIPNSITKIESNTFANCRRLSSVTFTAGSRLTSIGSNAFSYCFQEEYGSITIPASVKTIESSAFMGCALLTDIPFEEESQLTTIESNAFSDCYSLITMTIPASVQTIADAFVGNCKLLEIHNQSSLTIYNDYDSVEEGDDPVVIPNIKNVYSDERDSMLSTFENGLVIYADGADTILVAYRGTSTTLTIPAEVTEISDYALFGQKELLSVVIPGSVKRIGQYAFQDCLSLTKIVLQEGVTEVGEYAFMNCFDLTDITLPNSLTDISSSVITNCVSLSLTEYDNASYLGTDATPYRVLIAAKGESITNCKIHRDAKLIANYAFNSCPYLLSVDFEEESQLERIGKGAFAGCSLLTSITIPKNLKEIGDYAFSGADKLIEIYNKSDLKILSEYPSDEEYEDAIIIESARNIYTQEGGSRLSTDEKGFHLYIEGDKKILVGYSGNDTQPILPNDITSIYDNAFYYCKDITFIEIPASVSSIGSHAFDACSALTEIRIADRNTRLDIDLTAFYYCKALQFTDYDSCKYLGSANNPYYYLVDYNPDKINGFNDIEEKDITIHPDTKAINRYAMQTAYLSSVTFDGTLAEWDTILKYDPTIPVDTEESASAEEEDITTITDISYGYSIGTIESDYPGRSQDELIIEPIITEPIVIYDPVYPIQLYGSCDVHCTDGDTTWAYKERFGGIVIRHIGDEYDYNIILSYMNSYHRFKDFYLADVYEL